jgi:preprotein translocase subunit SecY
MVMVVAVIAFVVFMERALRKIHIQYPRRQVGMKIYDGGSSHLPIKVNPAGVIPAIFASSLCCCRPRFHLLGRRRPTRSCRRCWPISARPAAAICCSSGGDDRVLRLFLHPNVSFKVDDVAENLKNQNGFIPGIRPGKKTEEYLEYVVNRILVLGSAYLAAVCLLPEVLISKRRRCRSTSAAPRC